MEPDGAGVRGRVELRGTVRRAGGADAGGGGAGVWGAGIDVWGTEPARESTGPLPAAIGSGGGGGGGDLPGAFGGVGGGFAGSAQGGWRLRAAGCELSAGAAELDDGRCRGSGGADAGVNAEQVRGGRDKGSLPGAGVERASGAE